MDTPSQDELLKDIAAAEELVQKTETGATEAADTAKLTQEQTTLEAALKVAPPAPTAPVNIYPPW